MVTAAAMPYRNPMGDTFDAGDFGRNLCDALRLANNTEFAQRKRLAKADGKLRGIGLSVYVEPDGLRDGRARITFDTTGAVTVAVSAHTNGQGHETTVVQ